MTDKFIKRATFEAFLQGCEPAGPKIKAAPQPPMKQVGTTKFETNVLTSLLADFLGAGSKTSSSLDPIAKMVSDAAKRASNDNEIRSIAECLLSALLGSASARAQSSTVSSGSIASSRPLSVKLLHLCVVVVWPDDRLYHAIQNLFVEKFKKAVTASYSTEVGEIHAEFACLFIGLAGRVLRYPDTSDWCIDLMCDFDLSTWRSILLFINFVILCTRLIESAFEFVATSKTATLSLQFSTNPSRPKANFFDENMAYLPACCIERMQLVYRRIQFQVDASNGSAEQRAQLASELELPKIRALFEQPLIVNLISQVGLLNSSAFLTISSQLLPSSPATAAFLRQHWRSYAGSFTSVFHQMDTIASVAESLSGTQDESRVLLANILVSSVSSWPHWQSDTVESRIWVLERLQKYFSAGAAAQLEAALHFVSFLPGWMWFSPINAHEHSNASLVLVNSFFESVPVKDSWALFETKMTLRRWLAGFLDLLPKATLGAIKVRSAAHSR